MRYTLLTGSHGRWEKGQNVQYKAGDEIDLSADEVKSFGKRVEPVAGATFRTMPTKADPTDAPKPAGSLGLADVNMPDAVDKVAKLGTVEALDAAAAEELAGKDRKGVHEAIEERRAELAEK
jgi:hypothetical protein